MSKGKVIVCITLAVAMVVTFGIVLVYNTSEFFEWRRDGRIAWENTRMVQNIFSAPMEDAVVSIDDIINIVISNAEDEVIVERPDMSQFRGVIDALDEVRAVTGNEHIIAYIYISGTNVNNVVMQTTNNSFYLSRDIFGRHNLNGSLFMDFRNNPDFMDRNTIIYGHNNRDGTIFHNLRYYVGANRLAFFEAHPHIIIVTDSEVLIYEIFSTFSTRIDFNYIQVDFDDDEFEAFVQELNTRRVFDTGILATVDDSLLILSSCTNVHRDERIVVASRLAGRFLID